MRTEQLGDWKEKSDSIRTGLKGLYWWTVFLLLQAVLNLHVHFLTAGKSNMG
jgi:hypothetical protein